MRRFGRREDTETRMKSKLRHGLMSVVIFDHQEVCSKAKYFITSIASAAISLANWSTYEENGAIQDTCSKLYELSMLVSTVIDLFSKEYSAMGNSLKELLLQEMNLDALNKKVCQAQVKATKLKKQNTEKEKKLENLGNAELEYEELKASFDAQNTKHEILKAQCLRESISRLADGTATFGKRLSTISEAQKEIANSIPIVPTQISRNKEYQGEEATDKVVKRTADVLNIARPVSFKELLAEKQARARKLRVKSCFLPEAIKLSSPEELDWVTVEQSMAASLLDLPKDSEWRNQERRLSAEMLSSVKDRLAIDNPNGRSYISHAGIQQRLAFRARGLTEDERPEAPVSPPPRSPARKVPPEIDVRVEPYAVGRWAPDERGLYARANLLSSGFIRHSRSWDGNESNRSEIDNESGEYTIPRQLTNSGEYKKPTQFTDQKEVVYAVLEQEGTDVNTDQQYLDVMH